MERKFLYGDITPNDLAHALISEYNRGNLQVQTVGNAGKIAVQITTRISARSGGQTALTISIQRVDEGVMIEIGEQALFGVAASIGATALSALRNPFSLLGRLDDLAQDIEYMQLKENVWKTISAAAKSLDASYDLSDRLKRIPCIYCGTANEIGTASCIACGAPMGLIQPGTCPHCGFITSNEETICPNCNQKI